MHLKTTARFNVRHLIWQKLCWNALCRHDVMNISFVTQQPSATSLKQSVKDRLGPMLNSEPSQDSSVASQVCVCVRWWGFSHMLVKICKGCVNIPYLFPLQQNCSKMSVKDRLGFSAQPAAPAEKVSRILFELLPFSFKLWKWYMLTFPHPPFLGVFHIFGAHKDGIQSCCPEGGTEKLRGSPEEETGEHGNGGRREVEKKGHYRRQLDSQINEKEWCTFFIIFTASSKTTAGCTEEEARNTGETHWDTEGKMIWSTDLHLYIHTGYHIYNLHSATSL